MSLFNFSGSVTSTIDIVMEPNHLPDSEKAAIETGEIPLGKCSEGEPLSLGIVETDPRLGEQVLASNDILPLIFSSLKDLFDSDESSWKGYFYSLLLVNRSFGHFASSILWNTMESMVPLLNLLPWFKSNYQGLGAYRYSGADDWRIFNQYAGYVQHFAFRTSDAIPIGTLWIFELTTIQDRPINPFRALRSISVYPGAYSGLPILFLIVEPSLESLEVATCQPLSDYATIPPDWTYGDDASFANKTQHNMLAVLPRISAIAFHLQSFHYRGPVSEELLYLMSSIRSLISLQLTIANSVDVRHLKCLSNLPLLCDLKIIAPLLNSRLRKRSKKAHSALLSELVCLTVAAPGLLQQLIAFFLRPQTLHQLNLEFGEVIGPYGFCSTVEGYFLRNPDLRSIDITFSSWIEVDDPTQEAPPISWIKSEKEQNNYSLKTGIALEKLSFTNVPSDIRDAALEFLTKSMHHWKSLKSLKFRLSAQVPGATTSPVANFPGLSFLHSTIMKECPSLETLEFHFDEAKIVQNDLARFLPTDVEAQLSGPHPLRELTINTHTHKKLDLEWDRKVQIATFLDCLFPQLSSVQGSASETWDEIRGWVRSYQSVKARVYAQIFDALCD